MNITGVTYQYEVAYSYSNNCSDADNSSFPKGDTVYSPRTANSSFEVSGLMSGTCYILGVRAFTSVTSSPGVFTLVNGLTQPDG